MNSSVVCCPRCGQDHDEMLFWRFQRPVCVSVQLVADIYAKGRPDTWLHKAWRQIVLALVKHTLPECLPVINGGMVVECWASCPVSLDPILVVRIEQPAFDRLL